MKARSIVSLVALLCCVLLVPHADAAVVKQLMVQPLPDVPGKEALMLEVSYPPGAKDMAHRHDAHALVYVLEGTIQMQLKSGPLVTLKRPAIGRQCVPHATSNRVARGGPSVMPSTISVGRTICIGPW
jgi:hypothetical protein